MAQPRMVTVASRISEVDSGQWDACANPVTARYNPFVSHAFLKALEDAGTIGGKSGWHPQHLILRDDGGSVSGCMPLYLKSHSQGEYVFDHAFADALHRAGGRYYPKLQCAVPFTPVPGPRLLVRPGSNRGDIQSALALAAIQLTGKLECSSVHVTFLEQAESDELVSLGFLQRTDQQFHWHNAGYETFEGFLSTLASRKRKAIRKERTEALQDGIEIECLTGAQINERHWDHFYEFYQDTGNRKWGRPYLNRKFFSVLGQALSDRCLLIMARRAGAYVAGALNMIGGDCLFGRYWGATEQHACLHFEVCYYQAIDWAITHRLARVEAGAQGAHKLARGYLPATTYSAHWFKDPRLSEAVGSYLAQERMEIAETAEFLTTLGPFKKIPIQEAD
ncbi:MAG: GNAT family N-acetyltransferase [Hyphomicrobium sp.]